MVYNVYCRTVLNVGETKLESVTEKTLLIRTRTKLMNCHFSRIFQFLSFAIRLLLLQIHFDKFIGCVRAFNRVYYIDQVLVSSAWYIAARMKYCCTVLNSTELNHISIRIIFTQMGATFFMSCVAPYLMGFELDKVLYKTDPPQRLARI